MNRRTTIVYVAAGFVAVILLSSLYFLVRKPERVAPAKLAEGTRVVVFKDVRYSGEKKGVIDWELKAKTARKFLDKPIMEMEEIDGIYKPKPDMTLRFTAEKGEMNQETERGHVEKVEVFYKNEYTVRTNRMEFDFKQSLASTTAPVDVKGTKMTLNGMGLTADTKGQVIRVEKDVTGTVETARGPFRFSSDVFTYQLKEQIYVFEGRVVVRGKDMDLMCDRMFVYSEDDQVKRIDAKGKVQLLSKGTVAKGGRAVYDFKDERVVLTESPTIVKGRIDLKGEPIVYNLATGTFLADRPRLRIEQQ